MPTLPRIHRLWSTSAQPRSMETERCSAVDQHDGISSAGSIVDLSGQLAAVQRNYGSLSLVVQNKQEKLQEIEHELQQEKKLTSELKMKVQDALRSRSTTVPQLAMPRDDSEHEYPAPQAMIKQLEGKLADTCQTLHHANELAEAERNKAGSLQKQLHDTYNGLQSARAHLEASERRESELLAQCTQLDSQRKLNSHINVELANAQQATLAAVSISRTELAHNMRCCLDAQKQAALAAADAKEQNINRKAAELQLQTTREARSLQAGRDEEKAAKEAFKSELELKRVASSYQAKVAEEASELLKRAHRREHHLQCLLDEANTRCTALAQEQMDGSSEFQKLSLELAQTQALLCGCHRQLAEQEGAAITVLQHCSTQVQEAHREAAQTQEACIQIKNTYALNLTEALDHIAEHANEIDNFATAQEAALRQQGTRLAQLASKINQRFSFWAVCLSKILAAAEGLPVADVATNMVDLEVLRGALSTWTKKMSDIETEGDTLARAWRRESADMLQGFRSKVDNAINMHEQQLAQLQADVKTLRHACTASAEAARCSVDAQLMLTSRKHAQAEAEVEARRVAQEAEQERLQGQLAALSRAHDSALEATRSTLSSELDQERSCKERLVANSGRMCSILSEIQQQLVQCWQLLGQLWMPSTSHHSQTEDSHCFITQDAASDRPAEGAEGANEHEGELQEEVAAVQALAIKLRHQLASAVRNGYTLQEQALETHMPAFPPFSEQERTLHQTIDKLVAVEESLEANYTCMRCLRVFQDPVACVPCGHIFCRPCITDPAAAAVGPRCPECALGSLVSSALPLPNLDRLCAKFEFKLSALRDLQGLCARAREGGRGDGNATAACKSGVHGRQSSQAGTGRL